MKIVIDIPDETYKCVMDGAYCGSLYEELKNGVPVEPETCGDCVSRKELLKKFTYDYKGEKIPEVDCDNFPTQISFKDVKKWIRELPSVTQERPRGKWIDDGDCIICNKCHKAYGWLSIKQASNYCPDCGSYNVDIKEVQGDII